MLNGVGVVCFTGSYLLAFLLELIRFRWSGRCLRTVSLALLLAGLTAHTAYLFHHFILQSDRIVVSAGGWFFVLAWGLVLLDLYLSLFYPKTPFDLFLLPLVFLTIPAGVVLTDSRFPASTTGRALGTFHGISLLLTAGLILFGFLTGVMFFLQRAKLRSRGRFFRAVRLPSLEWLQKANRRLAKFSLFFLGCGIVSGLYLRHLMAQPTGKSTVPLADFMMIGAVILFFLLFSVLLIVSRTDPNRSGGRIALLSIASFLFLTVILGFGIGNSKAHWILSPRSILIPTENNSDKAVPTDEKNVPVTDGVPDKKIDSKDRSAGDETPNAPKGTLPAAVSGEDDQ